MSQFKITKVSTIWEYKYTFVTADTAEQAKETAMADSYSGGWIVTDEESAGDELIGCEPVEELQDRLKRIKMWPAGRAEGD